MFLLLLLVGASAHMPTFGDCHIDNTVTKSWGVYARVNHSYSCLLNVPAGENVSFSVNLPASYTAYNLSITLFGHGAADIECDPDFSGWGRRLDAGIDSTKTIPVRNETKLVFEPFGVGGYRAVAACQGRAVIGDDLFNLTVRNLRDGVVPISIGVGMAESFNALEVFLMSFSIARTWSWAGADFYILTLCTTVLVYILLVRRGPVLSHLVRCGLIVNSVQFACQLLYLNSLGVPVDNWFPWVVHVSLPLVAYVLFPYIKGWAWVLFLVYTYAALWQGYCVPFVALFLLLSTKVIRHIYD